MNALEITSMSTKGQIVIPMSIRSVLNVDSGAKFVVVTDGENILLKPIEQPRMMMFKELVKKAHSLVKDAGIKHTDLKGIIKKARSEDRS